MPVMRNVMPTGRLVGDDARRLLALQASARTGTIGAITAHRLRQTLLPSEELLEETATEAAGGDKGLPQETRSSGVQCTADGPYDGQHSPRERLGRPPGGPRAHLPPRREPLRHLPPLPPPQSQQQPPKPQHQRCGWLPADKQHSSQQHQQQRNEHQLAQHQPQQQQHQQRDEQQARQEQQHQQRYHQQNGTGWTPSPPPQPQQRRQHTTRSPRYGSAGVGSLARGSDSRDSDGWQTSHALEPSHRGPQPRAQPSWSSVGPGRRRMTMTHKPSNSHQGDRHHQQQQQRYHQQHSHTSPGQALGHRRHHQNGNEPTTTQQQQPRPQPSTSAPQPYTELGGALIHARHCLSRALAAAVDQEQLLALLEVSLYPYGRSESDSHNAAAAGWPAPGRPMGHSGTANDDALQQENFGSNDDCGTNTVPSATLPLVDPVCVSAAVCSMARLEMQRRALAAAEARAAMQGAKEKVRQGGQDIGGVGSGSGGPLSHMEWMPGLHDADDSGDGGWLGQVPGQPVGPQGLRREGDWGSARWQEGRRRAAEVAAAAAIDAVQVVKAAAARVAASTVPMAARRTAGGRQLLVHCDNDVTAHRLRLTGRSAGTVTATAGVIRIGRRVEYMMAEPTHSPVSKSRGGAEEQGGKVTAAAGVLALARGRVAAAGSSTGRGDGRKGGGGMKLETASPLTAPCGARGVNDDEATRHVVSGCDQGAVQVRQTASFQASATGDSIMGLSIAGSDRQAAQSSYTRRTMEYDAMRPTLAEAMVGDEVTVTAPAAPTVSMGNITTADGALAVPPLHGRHPMRRPSPPLAASSSAPCTSARPFPHHTTINRFLQLIELALRQCLAASEDLVAMPDVPSTSRQDATTHAVPGVDAICGGVTMSTFGHAGGGGGGGISRAADSAVGARSGEREATGARTAGTPAVTSSPPPLSSSVIVAAIAAAAAAAPVLRFRPREAANVVWGLSSLRLPGCHLGASEGVQELLVHLVGSLLPPPPPPLMTLATTMMSAVEEAWPEEPLSSAAAAAAAEGADREVRGVSRSAVVDKDRPKSSSSPSAAAAAAEGYASPGPDMMTSLAAAAESAKSKLATAAASGTRRFRKDNEEEVPSVAGDHPGISTTTDRGSSSTSSSSFGTARNTSSARSCSSGINSQQRPRWRSGELAMTAWGMARARATPPSRDWLLSYLTAWNEQTLAAATLPELACLAWALAWWQRLAVQSEMWILHGQVGATRRRRAAAAVAGNSLRLPRVTAVHSPSSLTSPSPLPSSRSRPRQQQQWRRRLSLRNLPVVHVREVLPSSWLEAFWAATLTHLKLVLPAHPSSSAAAAATATIPSSCPSAAPARTPPPYTDWGASELAMLLWSLGNLRLLPPQPWLDVALRAAATAAMANTAPPPPPLALATTLRGVAQMAALQPVTAEAPPPLPPYDNGSAVSTMAHDGDKDADARVVPLTGSRNHPSQHPPAMSDGPIAPTAPSITTLHLLNSAGGTALPQPQLIAPSLKYAAASVKAPILTPVGTMLNPTVPPQPQPQPRVAPIAAAALPTANPPSSAPPHVLHPPTPPRRCPTPPRVCQSLPAAFARSYLVPCVAAMESFGPSQGVELLKSIQLLAASGHLPPPTSLPLPLPTLLDAAAARLQRCHHHFLGPRHCLAAAAALVQLGHTPRGDWVTWWLEEMYGGLRSAGAGALREHELMRVVQALTAFHVVPGATWTSVLLAAFTRRLPYMSRTFMTDMLTALAAAGLRLGGPPPSERRRQELSPPPLLSSPSGQYVRQQRPSPPSLPQTHPVCLSVDSLASSVEDAAAMERTDGPNCDDSHGSYGADRTYCRRAGSGVGGGAGGGGHAPCGSGAGSSRRVSEWSWLVRVLREWGSRPGRPEPWCGGGGGGGGDVAARRRGSLSHQPASHEELKRLLTAIEALAGPPATWPPAPRAALRAALARGKQSINRNQMGTTTRAAPVAATSAAATVH